MANSDYYIRTATPNDADDIRLILTEHGPSILNYLPQNEVDDHVSDISNGKVLAVVAQTEDALVGVSTYQVGQFYPQYQPPNRTNKDHGYLAETVVHREYVSKGIGTLLLKMAISNLQSNGIKEIYAKRHADNIASRRMMEKCGLIAIDEFYDPTIRPTGSRRTTVSQTVL